MPLVRRHIASKEATTSDDTNRVSNSAFRNVRTYAQAASLPILSIHIPEPITTHNSYSMLNEVTSDSNSTPDSDKYMWNSPESTSDSSELTDSDSDMPALIDANDGDNEDSDTDYSDMPPLIDESSESQSESESDADQEIIVNQTRYQRVRKSCKDSLPCPITFFFRLWAIAMFMQCILHICNLTNDKCSRRL